jgi:hypothetical protein
MDYVRLNEYEIELVLYEADIKIRIQWVKEFKKTSKVVDRSVLRS